MTIQEEIRFVKQQLALVQLRLNGVRGTAGSHNFLGAEHADTVAANPVAGDVIYANATPKWTRRAKANNGDILTLVAGFPDWAPPGAPTEAGIAFTDNFADASRFWAWSDLNTGASRVVTEAAGVLTLAISAGTGSNWWTGLNASLRCVIGLPGYPCTVESKLNSYTVNNETHCGIFLSLDPYGAAPAADSTILFGRLRNGATDTVFCQSLGGTVSAGVGPNLQTLPIWLRFRIGNDCYPMTLVYADYSTDGAAWTNLWSGLTYPTAYYNNLATGVFAKTWGANPAASPVFEYFKMFRSLGPG